MGIIIRLRIDFKHASPCPDLVEIHLTSTSWRLTTSSGAIEHYDAVSLPIYNELFQLLRLSNGSKKKWAVLFNDQVTQKELRLIHLKTPS